jgi:glutathione synthase/RimK-type ligase-like ATP-grasp enzyme
MPTLGIMVEKINKEEYELQCLAAPNAGFERVVLFTPGDVDLEGRRLKGWVWSNGQWEFQHLPSYPDFIYDRGIYERSSQIRQAGKVKRKSGIPFVGDWLGNNKWIIQQKMAVNPRLRPHLIPSRLLVKAGDAYDMLAKYNRVIIKPAGTHAGAGIKLVYRGDRYYGLMENDRPVEQLTRREFSKMLEGLKRRHLIQKWLQLQDDQNRNYDIRVLMQKNEKGKWHLTGKGVRYGKAGSITSNLATGGEATEINAFLNKQFGEAKAKQLISKLRELGYEVSAHLEKAFQKRLVELGLDFGIDRKGRIWIIEANTKPGKKLLEQLCQTDAFRNSLQLPIQFAGFLLKKPNHNGTVQASKQIAGNRSMVKGI